MTMILSNINKNLLEQSYKKLKLLSSIERAIEHSSNYHHQQKMLKNCSKMSYTIQRYFHQTDKNLSVQLPPLTDDPLILMPSFFKAMKATMVVFFQIKPNLDPSFDLIEFTDASKQAVEVVSHALGKEDYDSLFELMDYNVIEKLKARISKLSEAQKELIPVKEKDIYGCFPYRIDLINDGEQPNLRTFVEVTMGYYSLRGFSSMLERGEKLAIPLGILPPEYQEKVYISNYRFRRDYTDGRKDAPWIVSLCNHMMLLAKPIQK